MKKWILVLVCLLVWSKPIGAGGLRTTFVEVKLDNLKLGQRYNITELINLPLAVENTGDKNVNLKIDVLPPNKDELKEGYEPLPDSSWIKIAKDLFEVEPKGMAVTDVIISIPDDERYLGKRYQAWIWSHTVGPGMIGVGLKSRILFSIAEAAEQTGQDRLSILPTEIYVTDTEIGEVFDVKEKSGG